jgi:hypothetical protein
MAVVSSRFRDIIDVSLGWIRAREETELVKEVRTVKSVDQFIRIRATKDTQERCAQGEGVC